MFVTSCMEIVGEKLKNVFLQQNRGCSAMARRSEHMLAVARFVPCIAPDMNPRCGESELAVASLAGQNLHNFQKISKSLVLCPNATWLS
jgi:hypothetical protein